MRPRDPMAERILRLVTVAYLLFVIWQLAGRPAVRDRLDHAARRTLRRVSEAADHAATRIGDRLIDRHNTNA